MIYLIVQTGCEGCYKEWMSPFHIIANFTESKGNPWIDFLMVIMTSGIARVHDDDDDDDGDGQDGGHNWNEAKLIFVGFV